MGRFKIYDSKKLIRIENDSNYGKCLLCERKLKNIMGNIKRHYQQMHSVFVDANARKSKKCKNKKSKLNRLNKPSEGNKMLPDVNYAPLEPEPKSEQRDPEIKTTPLEQQMQVVTTLQLEPQDSVSSLNLERKKEENFVNGKQILRDLSDNQLSTYNSNVKRAKLIEENDEIQIPCHSYINNIQINSVGSCHQLDFLKCLVETKAQVNIPLKTFLNNDTFQKALQHWKLNFQFNYSPQTIGEHIDRLTKKLHQEIKKLVANRLIYLKLDIVNSQEGNVMLVNVQYIKDFRLQVITLNVLELSDDDLSGYLKEKVISTLGRFRIEISNVFSIIKDNTKNVRKYSENPTNMCEYPSNTEYCQNLSHGFPGHAIHFAASDFIAQLNENISQSRDSARNLHKQMLQLKSKSTILFDNNNSWFSVYDMIESLIKVHDEIESNSLLLVEVDWVFAKKFVESYRPIVDTALMLQSNEIVIMGDFYREWLLCEMQLEELAVRNELALYLLKVLYKRKMEFFENSSFLAALYIDPRFCYMGSMHLNDKQKEIAIIQLLQIFNKIKAMHANTMPNQTDNSQANVNDRYDKLERQNNNNVKTNIDTTTNHDFLQDIDDQRVKELLEQLQFEERLVFKTNILEYWNVAKYKNPTLAKIAEVALAAPATQATLSRALNASSITLLKRKLNAKNENIENLLLLKLNQDLADNISLEN